MHFLETNSSQVNIDEGKDKRMNNHQQLVSEAQTVLQKLSGQVSQHKWKLQYHVAPPANWMNDPNGFSFFKGEYHLFYQHHPYSPEWGPMHWGHVKSKDLVNWDHLPIALAPSEVYDRDGCFSGSAFEHNGQLYLMYTGNVWTGEDQDHELKQTQALAVSDDGIHFKKLNENPVIEFAPEGDIHPLHIRDPKVWAHNGKYYAVLGSKTNDNTGQVLLYCSDNLIKWKFISVMAKGEGNFGFMWECPDLFELNGKEVLIISPQGMTPEGDYYHNLHQAGYVSGQLDYETGKLKYGSFLLLDHGFDYYAPQTMQDDKGRRVLIAWMDMWESRMPTQDFNYSGGMTFPRLVQMIDDKLFTTPVPELELLRKEKVQYEDVIFQGEQSFAEVEGDCIELNIVMDVVDGSIFGLKLRVDETRNEETILSFNKVEGTVTLNRNRSGVGPGGIRKTNIEFPNGKIQLQILVDKSSIEVFMNHGEKVMTARIFPSGDATAIKFFSDNAIKIDVLEKWEIKQGVK